jgi:proteasome lid subunit RPN8/RPN11
MRNVEDSPIGYSLDPKEQLMVEKRMRTQRQKMLGIYHSHTASDAVPSTVDVSLAISGDISYVLVSLKEFDAPVMKSYRINGSVVTNEDILVGESERVG